MKAILLFCAFLGWQGQSFATHHDDNQHAVDSSSAAHAAVSAEHGAADAHGASHAEGHGEEKFNAGKMIMDHIKDAHDWHIMDVGGHAVSIPLPVIIYNSTSGKLDMFMSSRFEHGHASYNGYKLDGQTIVAENGDKLIDFSITKNVAGMLVAVLLICIIFFSVAKAARKNEGKAPSGLQNLVEPMILFVRDDIAKPAIGAAKYEKFMPFLLTLFAFIFFNNLLGLIPIFPGGANVTGNIAITMVLAVLVFLITSFSANAAYWKHIFLPDVPKALYILMIPIEIMGVFIKPVVLMLRLFANITAGHIIMLGFFSLIFIFGEMNKGLGYGVSAFSVAFTVFMSFLELLVAFLQAYVFTLLASLYFGQATEDHHHHEPHESH